jgi:hypothetical protein
MCYRASLNKQQILMQIKYPMELEDIFPSTQANNQCFTGNFQPVI